MNGDELRAIQAPLKERYRGDDKAGLVTLKANGALDSATIACKVETGRALAVAGLHPASGGSGAELCSGDMLLEALVACAGVTLKAVATSMGIELRSGKVAAEGDLDNFGVTVHLVDAGIDTGDVLYQARFLPTASGCKAPAFRSRPSPRRVIAPITCASRSSTTARCSLAIT